MPTEADVAWCAGFLDGEGSFLLSKVTGTDRRKATISADQIEREPLDKLARTIGGTVSGPVRRTSAGSPIYRWIMRGDLRVSLPLLLPHLVVKRRRAELILEHAKTFSRTHSRGVPEHVLTQRKAIEIMFNQTKKGGQ